MREEVALERKRITIAARDIDYVCGSHDDNLRYFESKSKIISVTVEKNKKEDNYYLEIIGKVYAL